MFAGKVKPARTIDNVFNSAYWHLQRKDMSEHEILTKLQKKTDNEEWIATVMASLRNDNYIDDKRFIASYIRNCFNNKKQGPNKIKSVLIHEKKVNHQELIDEILQSADYDFFELAVAALRKKWKGSSIDYKTRSKYYAYLAGRGFTSDMINHAIETMKEETNENNNVESTALIVGVSSKNKRDM
ncbi:regulatory protein RecX [Vibrio parahaemolyticus]|uniref:regulatory protein RecX n=1 Tax=Vibrio parahaemolyticus TaxID=670 RepID=UPI0006C0E37A|nr:hypothetical protein ACX10_15260 [Vibrio parahaemolyticus]